MSVSEVIAKYWIEAICGLIFTGAITLFSTKAKCLNKKIKELKLQKELTLSMARMMMIREYNTYMDKGYCPIYARDNIELMYNEYHKMGGNGVVTGLMKKLRELPTEEPKK